MESWQTKRDETLAEFSEQFPAVSVYRVKWTWIPTSRERQPVSSSLGDIGRDDDALVGHLNSAFSPFNGIV